MYKKSIKVRKNQNGHLIFFISGITKYKLLNLISSKKHLLPKEREKLNTVQTKVYIQDRIHVIA